MKIKTEQYAQALIESLSGLSPEKQKSVISNFAQVLFRNNDGHLLGRVIDSFSKIWNEQNSIVVAEIKSAHKIDENTEKVLIKRIKEAAKASEAEIKKTIEIKILGGVVIKYGDKIFDASLRSRLNSLRDEFSA